MTKRITPAIAKNAKPKDKPFDIWSEGDGMFLHVTPAGSKVWRCRYQRDGKNQTVVLGYFLDDGTGMSVRQARDAVVALRSTVRAGIDPAAQRAAERRGVEFDQASTFQAVTELWHQNRVASGAWTERTARKTLERLALYAFPKFGREPIASITPLHIETLVLGVYRKAQATADRLRISLSQIFDYAADHDIITTRNPVRRIARHVPHQTDAEVRPAVQTIEQAREVLQAIDLSTSSPYLLLYHRLIALTGVRESVAREACWSEFPKDRPGVWQVPAERMKGRAGKKRPLTVTLSRQAQQVVEVARALSKLQRTGSPLLFPADTGPLDRPRNSTSLNATMARVLKGKEFYHVPHGWRATLATIMSERHPTEGRDVIGAILSHAKLGVYGKYDRADHSEAAGKYLQEWADLLMKGAPNAFALVGLTPPNANNNVVRLRDRRAA